MKLFRSLALTALLAGAASLSLADAHAEGYGKSSTNGGTTAPISSQTFKTLDSDQSGSLSEAELSASANTSLDFQSADANKDGKLTLSEVQGAPSAPPSAKPSSMTN